MKKVKPNYKQKTKDEARASKQFEYFETGALRHAVYYVSGKAILPFGKTRIIF
jgi:hypothetical protein